MKIHTCGAKNATESVTDYAMRRKLETVMIVINMALKTTYELLAYRNRAK